MERDYGKKVAAEKAAGEERKRLAKLEEQAKKAEKVREPQEEAARLPNEQKAAADAALEVSIAERVQATTL